MRSDDDDGHPPHLVVHASTRHNRKKVFRRDLTQRLLPKQPCNTAHGALVAHGIGAHSSKSHECGPGGLYAQ